MDMEYAPNSLQEQLNKHVMDNQKDLGELKDEVREMKRLLVGNDVTGEKGLVDKIDEIMEFVQMMKIIMAGGNFARKFVIWTLVAIGGAVSFLYTITKLYKEWFIKF